MFTLHTLYYFTLLYIHVYIIFTDKSKAICKIINTLSTCSPVDVFMFWGLNHRLIALVSAFHEVIWSPWQRLGGKLRYRYMFSSFPYLRPAPTHSPGDGLMGSRLGDCGGQEALSAHHMSGLVSRMFRIIVHVEICPPPPPLCNRRNGRAL